MANIARATGGLLPKEGEAEPFTRAMAERGIAMPAHLHIHLLQVLHRASRQIARFFGGYDMWLTPTLATPPRPTGTFSTDTSNADEWMDRMLAFIPFIWLANITGQPAMSVTTMMLRTGLPIGSHFMTRYGEERNLLSPCRSD